MISASRPESVVFTATNDDFPRNALQALAAHRVLCADDSLASRMQSILIDTGLNTLDLEDVFELAFAHDWGVKGIELSPLVKVCKSQ